MGIENSFFSDGFSLADSFYRKVSSFPFTLSSKLHNQHNHSQELRSYYPLFAPRILGSFRFLGIRLHFSP